MPSINMKSPVPRHAGAVRPHKYYLDFDDRFHYDDGPAVIFEDGGEEWWLHGAKHRADGPAIMFANGDEEWWLHGALHRDSGPATVHGLHKQWWFHGARHRENGPAQITPKMKRWYWYDELHREDGPAVEYDNGEEEWYKYGKLHRIDGPAVTRDDEISWHQDGECHRTDGPAFIDPMGFAAMRWLIRGIAINSKKQFKKLANISNEELLLLILKYGDIDENN